ncbi:hypothetical protein Cgig2_025688 [Carnegiea gigantea]|uniref:Uncharacterized protein n=1 Tax=Carnegiea gigantea TaxID=171969 RepID=A0A9Q1JTP1_9CARY|nr:hypothetical protein Cgig2_025688 [Carnegiea gigantea]
MLLNEAERLAPCTGKRFERWSQPSLSFVRAPLNRGCGCMVTEFSKAGSERRRYQRKVQGSAHRKTARRESFIWRQRRATHPPRPFPEDYHVLCPCFSLPGAKGVAADFELPEMVQATFYAMLLNEVVELGVVHGFMAEGLKSAPVGLSPRPLISDYHGLCPRFDLWVAMRYARDSNTLEMVQIIFYVMVIDDAAELGLSRRLTIDCAAEYVRDNLRRSVRETSSLRPDLLLLYFTASYLEFDHIMAMQFAHAAHIPEMVQAIFYVMVINGAEKLRLIRREIGESLMLDLRKLRWEIIEVWLLSIKDKLKDAQVSSPSGDGV